MTQSFRAKLTGKRFVWIFASFLLALGAGALALHFKRQSLVERPEAVLSDHPLELKIRRAHSPDNDALLLAVEVRNVGKAPISWDRDFVVFLRWIETAESGEPVEIGHAEGFECQPLMNRDRYVTIKSGESMTKEFDLNRFISAFNYRLVLPPSQDWERGHHRHGAFVATETKVRFLIPSPPKGIHVQLDYNGMEAVSFRGRNYGRESPHLSFFWPSFDDVRMWKGKCRSNEIGLGS